MKLPYGAGALYRLHMSFAAALGLSSSVEAPLGRLSTSGALSGTTAVGQRQGKETSMENL